jgi:hypothetical protein
MGTWFVFVPDRHSKVCHCSKLWLGVDQLRYWKSSKNEGPEHNEQNKYILNKYNTASNNDTNTNVWYQEKRNGKMCNILHTEGTRYTVEPSYNDIGLYDTSSIASDILLPMDSSLLTITLHSSVITILVYNDKQSISWRCNWVRLYMPC